MLLFVLPTWMVLLFRPRALFSCCLLAAIIPHVVGQMRPTYHITPNTNWMNDPQRPFFHGGEWHLYYLYNADWNKANPGAGGTEWYHVTSTDMVHWDNQGVAIRKYQPNSPDGVVLGDIETGSSVVDSSNSAGFGNDAVVAILTQMQDGVQQQSLFYSKDQGYTFTAMENNPVMPSPDRYSKPAFRDPKIFYDSEAEQWVIALAEGTKIGFYTSKDLKTWEFVSDFSPLDFGVDLGTLECPDLFQIDLDGSSESRTWILAMGANGYLHGRTTGTVYWAGSWSGSTFTTTTTFPQWLDYGPDFYATVSWENPDDRFASRYAVGWMNNWEYAATLPYYDGYEGQQSMVREVKYRTINGTPTLVSSPIQGYEALFTNSVSVESKPITTQAATASLPVDQTGGAFVIHATVTKADDDDGNEFHIRFKSDGTYYTDVGYSFANSQVFLARDQDGSATDTLATAPKEVWDAVRTGENPAGGNTVKLTMYVDYNSVEVFVNDVGVVAMSALIYPNEGAEGLEIVTEYGSLTLDSFTYAGFEG